jgi:hypothetical protein
MLIVRNKNNITAGSISLDIGLYLYLYCREINQYFMYDRLEFFTFFLLKNILKITFLKILSSLCYFPKSR